MKYSMMTYTMSRYPDFDIGRTIRLAAELNMSGVDLCFGHTMKSSIKDIKSMCDDSGLRVVANTFGNDINAPGATLEGWLDFLKSRLDDTCVLDCHVAMIPTPGAAGMSPSENRRRWIEALAEGVPQAKSRGITLTVENFPGELSGFVTSDHLLEAISEVPDLRVTYDNGNSATGEDPARGFEKIADHVVHAHFKDWDLVGAAADGFRKMSDGRYYRPALIGEGAVDQKACLRAMKAAGYDGHINIEYEGSKYDGADAVKRALDYLRALEKEL